MFCLAINHGVYFSLLYQCLLKLFHDCDCNCLLRAPFILMSFTLTMKIIFKVGAIFSSRAGSMNRFVIVSN